MHTNDFAGTQPVFDPVTFWTGHAVSWGVVENRAGAPTAIITTDCVGTPDGPAAIRMHETVTLSDGTTTHRDWRLRRLAPHRYEATANDMAAPTQGKAAGRAFHWAWTWQKAGGLRMHQWMYLMPNGTLLNRTTITKLGVTVAQVTEQFTHAP